MILANKIKLGVVDNTYEFEEHDREAYIPKDDGTFGMIVFFTKMRKFGHNQCGINDTVSQLKMT